MTVKKSKLAVLAILTAPAGGAVQITPVLSKVERIIITVDLPAAGGPALLQVTQPGNINQDAFTEDGDQVYNVTP